MSRIKSYDSFDRMDESIFDFSLSGAVKSITSAFGGAIKEKLVGVILSKIGLKEDSVLSEIVQELVDAIPTSDLYNLFTQDPKVWNSNYFAPKLAEATKEFIEREGFDTLAEKLGVDPKGMLYKTIKELAHDATGEKTLTNFYGTLLGGTNFRGSTLKRLMKDKELTSKEHSGNNVGDTLSSIWSGFKKGVSK